MSTQNNEQNSVYVCVFFFSNLMLTSCPVFDITVPDDLEGTSILEGTPWIHHLEERVIWSFFKGLTADRIK